MNELKNRKNKYTVFRAYNKYWLVDSSLIEKNSVDLFDISIICDVDNISINEVLQIAKHKVKNHEINYKPFITVRTGI